MAKVYGTNNLDVLDGWFDGVTDGDDTIFGYGGTDWIHGLNGNDILQGGEGADYLFGGNGQDTANYGDSPVGVYVNLQTTEGHSGGIAKLSFLRGRVEPHPGALAVLRRRRCQANTVGPRRNLRRLPGRTKSSDWPAQMT
jgi:RTX calcium-binding nonapeptide repeat (4 copies)